MSRPFFFRGGEESELKALVSFSLSGELGDAYDYDSFLAAWESGCEVEVVTKARKSALTGVDTARILTSVKQVTLKAEVKIIHNNARSGMTAKVWAVMRDVNGITARPKGVQNKSGEKKFTIEDPEWDLYCKKMQGALPWALRTFSTSVSLDITGLERST